MQWDVYRPPLECRHRFPKLRRVFWWRWTIGTEVWCKRCGRGWYLKREYPMVVAEWFRHPAPDRYVEKGIE